MKTSKKQLDILYLYDHPVRELDVACAVKSLLESKFGLTVEIAQSKADISAITGIYQPEIVVLPWYYRLEHYPYLLALRQSRFVTLAWEQLFYGGNKNAKSPHGVFAQKYLWHHAWGDFYVDFLAEYDVPKEHIFVNGNPSYTLYQSPYSRYFIQRAELAKKYGLDINRKWVFFPENYNWKFYDAARIKRFIGYGITADDMSVMQSFSAESFQIVMSWCNEIAARDDIELILRPRPTTEPDELRQAMLNAVQTPSRGFHTISGETVREWILASDLVVSSHSTSLIEAAVAEKPVFMLEPITIPEALHVHWHNFTPRIKSSAEFNSACENWDSKPYIMLRNWAQTTMMTNGDSIWNIAAFLAQLSNSNNREIKSPSVESLMLPTNRVSLPKWALYPYRRWQWNKLKSTYHQRTRQRDVIDAEKIQEKIIRWNKVLKDYQPTQVEFSK